MKQQPPTTRAEPVTEVLHGVEITDPYRWLEGDNSDPDNQGAVTPEVTVWTDDQNSYTRSVLDSLPGRKALEDRLRPLMEVGSITRPVVRGDHYFYTRREGDQNQPVLYLRQGFDGQDKVLIDPATLDTTGLTTLEWFSPSPSGGLLAYGTYRQGDENTTLHMMEVESLKLLDLEIPDRTQPSFWLPDESGFVYNNLKDPNNPYSGQVMFHRMGTDPADDALLFRQFAVEENEKLATTWGPYGSLSEDGRWLVLGYWIDTQSNDLWLVNFDEYLATGKVNRAIVTVGQPGLVGNANVIDGVLYLQTTKGAPQGRIVATDPAQPDSANWRDIVPERSDAVIESVAWSDGIMAVTYMKNASNVVEVFDLTGKSLGQLEQPGIGSVGLSAELDRTEAFLTFTSFNYPTSIFRVNLAAPNATPALWQSPEVPVDPESVEVEQVWYPSKDGTPISMFLVHQKGLKPNGATPTLLYGYGGFNISLTPTFSATLFQWFEAGGMYAMPNLRGGGEYGDAWHDAGLLERKQNVFDDFIAAGEWLIANGYTNPKRLAIRGGSNGGLLTGVLTTQRPDLFQAAIVAVPLLDMLRYQNLLMARYWVPEYGSAENPEQFKFLLEYSPYQNIKAGTEYPAVLLTAGENDSRVHPAHARKMAALLQASTSSNPAQKPVLLWVDRDAGHGQGKPLDLRLRDVVDDRIFVMWQLGMLDK